MGSNMEVIDYLHHVRSLNVNVHSKQIRVSLPNYS